MWLQSTENSQDDSKNKTGSLTLLDLKVNYKSPVLRQCGTNTKRPVEYKTES